LDLQHLKASQVMLSYSHSLLHELNIQKNTKIYWRI